MTEKNAPIVSMTTLIAMLFGIIIVSPILREFMWISVIVWAVCIAALFLCECLFKQKKRKQFTMNLGVFIAILIMGAVFTVWLLIKAPFDLSELEWGIACMSILPPMIVSLIVNICNIIYKAINAKADIHSDRQP